MKNNQLIGVLVGLLFLSAMASIVFVWRYNSSMHAWQSQTQDAALQQRLAQINAARNVMLSMYNDAAEYSRTNPNPEMMRILQGVNTSAKSLAKPVEK